MAPKILAPLLVVGYLLVVYGNVVFLGKSLVYTDNRNPLDPRFTDASYGPDRLPASAWHEKNLHTYPNFRDPGATWWQWEPAGEFLRHALADREMPFWDPYVGAGAPSMANLTSAHFFPPYLLVVWMGNTALQKNVYFLLLQLGSGLFTYLLLRRHGCRWQGAAFGAIAWMAGGAMVQNVGSFMGQTAACIPVALFGTGWFLEAPSWRRAGVLSLLFAAISLASFPPILLIVFGFPVVHVLVTLARRRDEPLRDRGVVICRFAAAGTLAAGLVAWYYAPALLAAAHAPHVTDFYRNAGLISFPVVSLFQLLSPVLMGGADVYLAPLMPGTSSFHVPYCGVVALAAATLADWRRGLAITCTIAGAGAALKVVGAPPVQWLGHLPGLNMIHFAHYFGIAVGFSAAVLAGFGVDRLVRKEVSTRRFLGTTLFFFAGGSVLLEIARRNGAWNPPQINRWLFEWCLLAAFSAGFLGLALLLVRSRAGSRGRALLLAGAMAVLAAEGLHNTSYPRQVRWNVWRHAVPFVEKLAARGETERVYNLGALPANTNGPFSIPSLDSLMTFNSPRVFEIYSRHAGARMTVFLRKATVLPPEPVLDACGITVLAVQAGSKEIHREARKRGHREVYRDGHAHLFERSGVSRCTFTSDYVVVAPGSALEGLPDLPDRKVLLEEPPAAVPGAPNRADDPVPHFTTVGRNRSVVTLSAPRPGLLYCADSHFPGWSATIDGRPVEILVANHAFRGVPIPAGEHEVRFRYQPPGWRSGLAISSITLLLTAVALVFGRRPGRPDHPTTRDLR